MKLPNVSKREQVLILISIFLASGFLIYRLMIYPGMERLWSARFYLNSQRDIQGVKLSEIQSRGRLNDRLQRLEKEMSETKETLFSIDEATEFLRSLPQMISGTKTALVMMKPGDMKDPIEDNTVRARDTRGKRKSSETTVESPCMFVPVQIDIRGEYSNIISLCEKLEENKKLVVVSKADLETASDNPAEVDATLTLNIYIHDYRGI